MMENWDKGIQMLEEAAPVDQETLDRIESYQRQRDGADLFHVHLISTPWRGSRVQALKLVQDPKTGAWGLPQDQEETG
jgi:hypothetical protein